MKRVISCLQQQHSSSFSRIFHPEIKSRQVFHQWNCMRQLNLTRSVSNLCWKCQKPLPENRFSLQCPTCQSLQKQADDGKELNYFEIFGTKEAYRIDLSKLSVEMKILQKNLHPDLFSLKTKEEQRLSEDLSSLVNKAYSTLQNPMERAEYLLRRRGIDSQTMEKRMTTDAGFLSEVMELNERLDEIDNPQEWAQFRQENDEKIVYLNGKLERAFDAENIDEAVLILSKMKYYDNLQQKLKTLQTRLGVVD